jgi:hypothetical protein
MENIKIETRGPREVIVTITLEGEGRVSGSGRSILLATTGGNVDIPGHPGVKLGVNVFKERPATARRKSRRG